MKKIAKKIILPLLLLSVFCVTGCSNNTPYIGENGNWWVDESDTGVPAQGPQGPQGEPGSNGIDGENGINGESVSVVSVEKTDSIDNVDTYTITFSDGSTSTFTVTNGVDGESVNVESVTKIGSKGLVDTYKIVFSDGTEYTFTVTNGADGECITIESIEKTGSDELVDTYTITLSDRNKFTFTVTNGKDGLTPYIGPNGNWWIGDEDTGEFASYNYETRDITDGLTFTPMTINGKGGFVVTGFDPAVAYGREIYDLLDDYPEQYASTYGIINIPDYLGTTPVIGVKAEMFKNVDYISKVSLSRNTVYLGDNVFNACSNLQEIDFNGAPLEKLPDYAFYKTKLQSIDLPETLETLGAYSLANTNLKSIELPDSLTRLESHALYGNTIKDIDINNVTYFADYSLYGIHGNPIYLTNDVEYVGSYAFAGTYVYIEHETIPTTWGSNIAGTSTVYGGIVTPNCLINDEYIYSKNGNEITVLNYIGIAKRIEIPSLIDSLPVTKIGYGFNSVTEIGLDVYENIYTEESGENYFSYMVRAEQVVIPNSVKAIDLGAFINLFTTIYIPSSVEKISTYALFVDNDDMSSNFMIFEANSYPTLIKGWVDGENDGEIDGALWFGDEEHIGTYRNIKNTKWEDVYFNEETNSYYIKDLLGYTLIAYMNHEVGREIVIESTFNNETVHTIRKGAVYGFFNHKSLIIEDGVKKIQSGAFMVCEDFNYVYIPSSVTIINAYGFDGLCKRFYTNHTSKPDEWDTQWAGYSTGSYSITYKIELDEIPSISFDGKYEYAVLDDGTVSLVKYLGSSSASTINVPRTIDGYTVTEVKSNCYSLSYSSSVYIYVPETIQVLEENAFYRSYSSTRTYVYFEAESALPGYHSKYINTSSSYLTQYWDRSIGYWY